MLHHVTYFGLSITHAKSSTLNPSMTQGSLRNNIGLKGKNPKSNSDQSALQNSTAAGSSGEMTERSRA